MIDWEKVILLRFLSRFGIGVEFNIVFSCCWVVGIWVVLFCKLVVFGMLGDVDLVWGGWWYDLFVLMVWMFWGLRLEWWLFIIVVCWYVFWILEVELFCIVWEVCFWCRLVFWCWMLVGNCCYLVDVWVEFCIIILLDLLIFLMLIFCICCFKDIDVLVGFDILIVIMLVDKVWKVV